MTSKAEFIKGTNFVEQLSSTDDMDDIRGINKSGFYYASSPVNRPSGTGVGFVIVISEAAAGVTLQIFVQVNAEKMFMRKYGSGTWTAWHAATFT